VSEAKDTDERIENAALSALKTGLVQNNDTVVITSGHPAWVKGTTNMLRVKKLGSSPKELESFKGVDS